MVRLAVVLAVGLSLVLGGCRPMTVGESCDSFLKAACTRENSCLGGTEVDTASCEAAGVPGCCGDARTCQLEVKDAAAVGRCSTEAAAVSCGGWRAWASSPSTNPVPIPAVCVGVAEPK